MRPLRSSSRQAFTLIELLLVILVLMMLMVGLRGWMADPTVGKRSAAAACLMSLLELARIHAIVRKAPVAVGLMKPSRTSAFKARAAIFELEDIPDSNDVEWPATMQRRWLELDEGLAWNPGSVDGMRNPLNEPTWRFALQGNDRRVVEVYGIIMDRTGRVVFPEGREPIILRIAEVHYVNRRASLVSQGTAVIPESLIKVGRLSGRPSLLSR